MSHFHCAISRAARPLSYLGYYKKDVTGQFADGIEWTEAAEILAKTSEDLERAGKFIPEKAEQNLPNSCTCNEMKQMHQQVFISFLSYVSFSESWMVFYEAQHSRDSWDVSRPLCRGEFGHSDLSKVRKS